MRIRCASKPIIKQVLKDLVDDGNTRFLITDDGDLSIEGETSGIFLSKNFLKEVEL